MKMTMCVSMLKWAAHASAAAMLACAGAAVAQDKGPIRIGVLAPITGPLATPGAEMINGMKMFWEQNKYTAGGRKIDLVIADTNCNPDQALTQARRLTLQEKVHFLIGPLCGHEGPAVAQVSRETGIPLIMDPAGADTVDKVGPDAHGDPDGNLGESAGAPVRRLPVQGTRRPQRDVHCVRLHLGA